MAFHNNLPLQHFSDQHLNTESGSILRDIIPNHHHHHHHNHHRHSSSAVAAAAAAAPTWLNNVLRQQNHYPDSNFLNLHTASESATSVQQHQVSNQWISRSILQRNPGNHNGDVDDVPVVSNDSLMGAVASISPDSTDANNNNNSSNHNGDSMTMIGHTSKINGGGGGDSDGGGDSVVNWQNARYKADILAHPLYEQLLSAHVTCLRIATPVDQLPRIDAQLAQSQQVVSKYSAIGVGNHSISVDDKELDQFMTHYVLLLCSFKEQLQQHVRVHAMEAVMACWEIEQSLHSLTGVSPGEGTGATMSDDDDELADSDTNLFDGGLDGPDGVGFGPLIPTESERSLMERVRQELKHELKQGYKEKIVDIREEILRKRRAGKLPGNTTSVLKTWWQSHSKWPYPTEEDKAKLVQQTGLQLKQINNWFINQRKRNWHSNPSSTVLKTKRKSNAGDTSSGGFI